jgi:hypothetical protein
MMADARLINGTVSRGLCPPLPLENFYKKNELFLPSFPKFRIFKFLLWNGSWITINRKVYNIEDLRKELLKYLPYKAYYSTCLWLNPHKVSSKYKPNQEIIKNLFLGSDFLVFDIDDKNIENAKQKSLLVLDYLKQNGFKILKIVFSGSKGFHIYFEPKDYYVSFHYSREEYEIDKRKKFFNSLPKEIQKIIDYPVLIDTRRIIKLPLTIDGSSGYKVSFVENLEKFDINKIEKIELPKIQIRKKEERKIIEKNTENIKEYYSLSSKIIHTVNRHIAILKFFAKNEKYIQKKINEARNYFSHIFVFRKKLKDIYAYYLVSLNALEFPHLLNIYKKISQTSYKEFKKYKQLDFPLPPKSEFVLFTLGNPLLNHPISSPHLEFFKRIGIDYVDSLNLTKGEIKFFKVVEE